MKQREAKLEGKNGSEETVLWYKEKRQEAELRQWQWDFGKK